MYIVYKITRTWKKVKQKRKFSEENDKALLRNFKEGFIN